MSFCYWTCHCLRFNTVCRGHLSSPPPRTSTSYPVPLVTITPIRLGPLHLFLRQVQARPPASLSHTTKLLHVSTLRVNPWDLIHKYTHDCKSCINRHVLYLYCAFKLLHPCAFQSYQYCSLQPPWQPLLQSRVETISAFQTVFRHASTWPRVKDVIHRIAFAMIRTTITALYKSKTNAPLMPLCNCNRCAPIGHEYPLHYN